MTRPLNIDEIEERLKGPARHEVIRDPSALEIAVCAAVVGIVAFLLMVAL